MSIKRSKKRQYIYKVIGIATVFSCLLGLPSIDYVTDAQGSGIVIIDLSKKKSQNTKQAQTGEFEVKVRTGKHAAYERVVLDLFNGNASGIRIDEEPGKVILTFKQEGAFSAGARDFKNFSNTLSIREIQKKPLKLELNVKEADLKTTKLKDKVILDFYPSVKEEVKTPPSKAVKVEPVITEEVEKAAVIVDSEEEQAPVEKSFQEAPVLDKSDQTQAKKVNRKKRESSSSSKRSIALKKIQEGLQKKSDISNQVLQKGSIVTLSSLTPLELAVFKRDNYLWIVQSTKKSGLPPLVEGPVPLKPRLVNDKYNNVEAWVLPIDKAVDYYVESSKFSWKIIVTDENIPNVNGVDFSYDEIIKENVKKPALAFDLNQVITGYEFEDPYVGDHFIAFPVLNSKYQVNQSQSFPQFEIIAAKAGLVLKKYSSDIVYFYEGEKLYITGNNAFMVSEPLVTNTSNPLSFSKEEGAQENSFFDVRNWFITSEDHFLKDRIDLERLIVESATDEARLNNILRLAKLYFAHGFAPETSGLLRMAKLLDKRLIDNPNFIALEGASLALAGRYSKAFSRLYDPRIKDFGDMALWRGYSHAQKGNWEEAYEELSRTGSLITQYPRVLQSKLVPVLTEASLQAEDQVTAQVLISILEEAPDLHRKEKSMLSYFQGRKYMMQNEKENAIEYLRAASNGADRYYRARAAFELLKLQTDMGEIEKEKALEVLERIRYIWRGDELEVSVMEYLSDLYYVQGKYKESLSTLSKILSLVKDDSKKTMAIRDRQSIIFKNLFIKEEGDKLRPLSALALYDEFSHLTPAGSDGDLAIQKLAERMVSVDLLDRASKLLEHQIRFRLRGEDVSRVGARLASIRLLDQTPTFALEALDNTYLPDVSDQLQMERRLLRARAYSQLNKPDEAIKTLEGLTIEMAHRLNVDINWKAERWDNAAKAINPLLEYLLKEGDFLNEEGEVSYVNDEISDLILNQSVAYILAGDLGSVKKLVEKYEMVMEDSKNAKLFQLITREPKAGQLADLQTLNGHVSEVDMFKDFLDAYRSDVGGSSEES